MNDHELEETIRRIVCTLHGEGLASAAAIQQILAAARKYARTPSPASRTVEALGQSIEGLRGVRENLEAAAGGRV